VINLDRHVQPRTIEIRRIFDDNREAIQRDCESLELSIREIAQKWSVNDRNVRQWMDHLRIDIPERTRARKRAGFGKINRNKDNKPKQEDAVRSPKLLSMKW